MHIIIKAEVIICINVVGYWGLKNSLQRESLCHTESLCFTPGFMGLRTSCQPHLASLLLSCFPISPELATQCTVHLDHIPHKGTQHTEKLGSCQDEIKNYQFRGTRSFWKTLYTVTGDLPLASQRWNVFKLFISVLFIFNFLIWLTGTQLHLHPSLSFRETRRPKQTKSWLP